MSVHVFETMGTTASLRVEEPSLPEGVLAAIVERFAEWEARFSLYRPESEITRLSRGEISLRGTSEAFRETYALALDWRRITDDAFTPHRPDGVIDLSGVVKAAAMAAAADLLRDAGSTDWLLDVGGDVLAGGRHRGGAWRIGVVDPADRSVLLCAVDLSADVDNDSEGDGGRLALATSGIAERGEHVWRSDRGAGHTRYVQVSVMADDIVTADVLATAILAGGPATCDELSDRLDIDVLTVDADGAVAATPGFRAAAGLVLA